MDETTRERIEQALLEIGPFGEATIVVRSGQVVQIKVTKDIRLQKVGKKSEIPEG